MQDGETYREKALHCLLAADRARDAEVRLLWLGLAQSYMTLADYADRRREHGPATLGDQDQDKDG